LEQSLPSGATGGMTGLATLGGGMVGMVRAFAVK
jgi:hypothetical protein